MVYTRAFSVFQVTILALKLISQWKRKYLDYCGNQLHDQRAQQKVWAHTDDRKQELQILIVPVSSPELGTSFAFLYEIFFSP